MQNNWDGIKQLESVLGRKLKKISHSLVCYRLTYKCDSYNNITELNLSHCNLNKIPEPVFEFQYMQSLNLYANQITEIPKDISKLQYMKVLQLAKNNLRSISIEILLALPKLKFLDVSHNELTLLPVELIDLESLREMLCIGNPFDEPPPEIIEWGLPRIREYLISIRKGERLYLNEVKIIFVGDGGTGKTSLIRRLISNDFDPNEPQTHGIKISTHNITSKNRAILLNIWDFGGQEIMHATHQFFLSKRSLYVLVLDSRKDEKTEYWLKHIESFGGNSPILVAINKADENLGFDINRKFLSRKYQGIRGYFKTSCATGSGIVEFLDALKGSVDHVQIAQTTWPNSWFHAKQKIQSINKNFISLNEYRNVCKQFNIDSETNQDVLVGFLHDLGLVLHFDDFSLLDTHVLNPKWVTNAVYRIVNYKKLAKSKGVLPIKWLQDILCPQQEDDFIYPREKYHFIIDLMLKFELCYQINSRELLIPDLLDIQEPDIPSPDEQTICFTLMYDYLPKSVMPRLIVRLHDDIFKGCCWRTGLIVSDRTFDAKAIIRADDRERQIDIWVTGKHRKEYLSGILFMLRDINASFQKLGVIEKIRLPDAFDIMISYDHLVKLRDRGVKDFFPEGAEKEYNVDFLLGGVEPSSKNEEEILNLLEHLLEQSKDKDSFIARTNRIMLLQPNIFGFGLDINHLIDRVWRRRYKWKRKKR